MRNNNRPANQNARSGGLTGSSDLLQTDPDWIPVTYKQSESDFYRIGFPDSADGGSGDAPYGPYLRIGSDDQ